MPRRVIAQPLPTNIRNWSFRGLDCAGWDFSGRDIRGCDFSRAQLQGANFSRVTAGRSREQVIREILILFIVAIVVSFLLLITVNASSIDEIRNVVTLVVAGIAATVGGLAMACIFILESAGAADGTFRFVISLTFAVAILVLCLFAFSSTGLRAFESFSLGQMAIGILWSTAGILFLAPTLYATNETIRGFKQMTGTNFMYANLQRADFSFAMLNNCNFSKANTTYVNWSNVTENNRSTLNLNRIQKDLLTSRKGSAGIYSALDMSYLYLAGIELVKANLDGADLTRSNLQQADLTFANLSNVKAGGADFCHAKLHGACIQNWTVNSNTQFDEIYCDFIYLTPDQNPQNRRPLKAALNRAISRNWWINLPTPSTLSCGAAPILSPLPKP